MYCFVDVFDLIIWCHPQEEDEKERQQQKSESQDDMSKLMWRVFR